MNTLRPIRSADEAAARLAPFDPVVARAIADKAGAPIIPDLSIRCKVLLALCGEPLLSTEIARKTGLTSHAVSSCVSGLSLKHLVEHHAKTGPGRAYRWTISPAGRDYLKSRGLSA